MLHPLKIVKPIISDNNNILLILYEKDKCSTYTGVVQFRRYLQNKTQKIYVYLCGCTYDLIWFYLINTKIIYINLLLYHQITLKSI